MGRKKQPKSLIRTINFGKKGEHAREIVEILINKKGNWGLSEEIRKAITFYFSNKKDFETAKVQVLLEERKQLQKHIPDISKQLLKNEELLNSLGYELKELE